MTAAPLVRQLIEADAPAFRELRLAGLNDAPAAFGSSFAAEKDRTVADFAGTIERNYLAGAFVDGVLVGAAGFYQLVGEKVAHRGNIWGVYVAPRHRGRGIARQLMENVMAHGRTIVTQVHLCVVEDNVAARQLYERLGFVTYGIEPRSLRVGDRFHDEYLMVWRSD